MVFMVREYEFKLHSRFSFCYLLVNDLKLSKLVAPLLRNNHFKLEPIKSKAYKHKFHSYLLEYPNIQDP